MDEATVLQGEDCSSAEGDGHGSIEPGDMAPHVAARLLRHRSTVLSGVNDRHLRHHSTNFVTSHFPAKRTAGSAGSTIRGGVFDMTSSIYTCACLDVH